MDASAAQIVTGLELWQWRFEAKQKAIAGNVPPNEVDWLLQEVAPLDRLSLRLETFKTRTEIPLTRSLADLTELWQRRIEANVPVQYLVGVAPWRNFVLTVSPAVLIPRPETEQIIDLAINAVQASPTLKTGHWSDLGTGSGAIILGLAESFPQATLHAVDYSLDALTLAQTNAQKLGLSDRIQFYHGSWFEPLSHLKGNLSGMVSNPPYIPSDMISDLQPEVSLHEPHLALDGGQDGLACIRHLITTAPDYLISGGIWLIELMAGQAEAVTQLLQAQGSYCSIQIHKDLAGIDRFVLAYRV
ncbi:peptide chain release factor N(5)-glutamine methyltransferase [filamentous cyanobacterium CCP2]|nr:peptide chain release factor N(5)-glutamine methyltransferase [filamentous cyanobacterium CCP2]